jgi:uncharacterized protein YndB with AHSA1/START domain
MPTNETASETVVQQEIWIEAPPERVYAFLTDAELMVRWMGTEVRLDPRPGGVYYWDSNGHHTGSGEFVTLEPYTKVSFTFGWEQEPAIPPGSTLVEIALTPEGAGTRVQLTHRALPSDAVSDHIEGWTMYLGRLAVVAGGGDAGPEPMAG